jgi:hypothetical protein
MSSLRTACQEPITSIKFALSPERDEEANWLGIVSRAVASRPWTAPERGGFAGTQKGRAGVSRAACSRSLVVGGQLGRGRAESLTLHFWLVRLGQPRAGLRLCSDVIAKR